MRRGCFKRIEIHDHQIDRRDAVLLRLLLILGMIAPIQQPAVHFRMQSFHAPAQHFRPAREFRNVFHRHAFFAQQLCRAAGRRISIFSAASFLANSTIPVLSNTLSSARSTAMCSSSVEKNLLVYAERWSFEKRGLWEKRTGKIRRTKIRTSRGL